MHVRTWAVIGVTTLLVGVGATAYARSGDDTASRYRTVAASTGTVEQTLTTSGTVDSAHRADVAFGVAGKVSSVKVHQGQQVKAGTVLITLDRTSLRADVQQANATLAKAKAQLAADEDAQNTTVTSSVTTGRSSGAPSGGTKPGGQQGTGTAGGGNQGGQQSGGQQGGQQGGQPGGGQPGGPQQTQAVQDALKQLAAQQQAVTGAQTTASQALADARSALQAQTTACSSAFQPQPTSSPSGGATPSGAADDQNAACTKALADVQAAQQAVDDDQQKLASALTTLADTLDKAITLLEKAAGTSTGTQPSAYVASARSGSTMEPAVAVTASGGSDTGTPNASMSTGSPTGNGTVTAARLASDQAAIDTARADLITARAVLARGVVTAPITGRVVALDASAGDTVASGDAAAVVTNGKALIVGASVTESRIRSIRTGQTVRVTSPGSSIVTTGKVATIGVTADTTSGTASYPVEIAVEQPKVDLPAGAQVVLEIVTGTVDRAVTVPSSAVQKVGTASVVRTLKNGQPSNTPVTVGTVGSRRTEITKGLAAGTKVVIADLDQQVTGASTSLGNTNGFGGANGGMRGRGGQPGGAGGRPTG